MQQPMQNPEDILDPITLIDMSLVLMDKAFTLNDTTPTINNQRSSSNPCNMQIAQPLQNVGNHVVLNAVQNPGVQNVGNQNGLSVDPGIANQCYNCQGVDHYARNCTVKPRKRDVAYLQTQLQIAQKEEAGIQLNSEEFDFMAAAGAYDEIEEVTANCTLKDNLQQASTSVSNVEQSGGTVEQHPVTSEETRAFIDSLYNNLATKVETDNLVNRNLKEINAELTTELARYKNQEKCFEINQEKYNKLERCYQKSVYQEQCLTKKINALHLSSAKMITTLNEKIANLNN
ncbi:retrovirus-related pol polyprotein from transposon TNT 1-94 [Tanacetum coccineum]